jgi:two-component system alkaline phosphatase synthesis response regulator PhoP
MRILLIEDEPGLVMTVSDLLAGEGYEVETAQDGESGFLAACLGSNKAGSEKAGGSYDAIILDLMLPRKSGLDVCRELRAKGVDTAILMLTARGQVIDRVVGLKLGADDYLTKPFDPAELLARLEALLRRVNKENRIAVETFEFADVVVDFRRAEVRRAGRQVSLASKELQLLRYLIDNRERVVPREEIMRKVWEYASEASSRTIDTHVAWLRQKLEENAQSPRHIQTIRGKGYRFTTHVA